MPLLPPCQPNVLLLVDGRLVGRPVCEISGDGECLGVYALAAVTV
jgi:hypothetical protein